MKFLFKIRHLLLKFCYGVEIGAHLAYVGHYGATKDIQVRRIANEELRHMIEIKRVLNKYDQKPNLLFNAVFKAVGTSIKYLCYVSPDILLDYVAQIMEKFAIFSYSLMAELYPEHANIFLNMENNERIHELYFTK